MNFLGNISFVILKIIVSTNIFNYMYDLQPTNIRRHSKANITVNIVFRTMHIRTLYKVICTSNSKLK